MSELNKFGHNLFMGVWYNIVEGSSKIITIVFSIGYIYHKKEKNKNNFEINFLIIIGFLILFKKDNWMHIYK